MALAEHSIDQTIDFIQSDSEFKLYNDRSKINGNDKRSDFKHGNPNVFHGKFRLRGGSGAVLQWEAAPLPCSVCRRATDRRRRRRLAPLLAYLWTLALASRKATMFWTSVSRSESTGGRRRLALVQGSGRQRPSMPLRGALTPTRGHALSTARR